MKNITQKILTTSALISVAALAMGAACESKTEGSVCKSDVKASCNESYNCSDAQEGQPCARWECPDTKYEYCEADSSSSTTCNETSLEITCTVYLYDTIDTDDDDKCDTCDTDNTLSTCSASYDCQDANDTNTECDS